MFAVRVVGLFTPFVAFPLSTMFPNYEIHERCSPLPSCHPSRSTLSNTTGSRDSQGFLPLPTSPVSQVDQWKQQEYQCSCLPHSKSTASSRTAHLNYTSPHTYPSAHQIRQSHDHSVSMKSQNHSPNRVFNDTSRLDHSYLASWLQFCIIQRFPYTTSWK